MKKWLDPPNYIHACALYVVFDGTFCLPHLSHPWPREIKALLSIRLCKSEPSVAEFIVSMNNWPMQYTKDTQSK